MLAGIAIWLINYCGHTSDVTGQMNNKPRVQTAVEVRFRTGPAKDTLAAIHFVVSEFSAMGECKARQKE